MNTPTCPVADTYKRALHLLSSESGIPSSEITATKHRGGNKSPLAAQIHRVAITATHQSASEAPGTPRALGKLLASVAGTSTTYITESRNRCAAQPALRKAVGKLRAQLLN